MAGSTQPRKTFLVTVATDPNHPHLERLVYSAKKNGFDDVVVLGTADKPSGEWRNLFKMMMFDDFLHGKLPTKHTVPKDGDVVSFVDGYDVMVNAAASNLDTLLTSQFHLPIIYGATVTCSPEVVAGNVRCCTLYGFPDSHGGRELKPSFLNGGLSFGYASAYRKFFSRFRDEIRRTAQGDMRRGQEQFLLHSLANRVPELVGLDTDRLALYNWKVADGIDVFEIEDGNLVDSRTGKTPVFIHVTGADRHKRKKAAFRQMFKQRFEQGKGRDKTVRTALSQRSKGSSVSSLGTIVLLVSSVVLLVIVVAALLNNS